MARSGGPAIGVGIIGCGRVCETRHLPALAGLSRARVVAVADSDSERRERVGDRFRIPARYADYRDLLERPEVGVVAVCLPATLHCEAALAVLEAGKHLLIEKPLALSLEDCDRILAQSERSRVKAMVGFSMRWHRHVRRAKELLESGVLGTDLILQTTFTSGFRFQDDVPAWRKRRDQGGGVIFEMGVHHFDLWRFLLGRSVEEVFAVTRSNDWDDEAATVTARLAGGALAVSAFSESTAAINDLEICGSKGRLRVSCYQFDGFEYASSSEEPGGLGRRLGRAKGFLKELLAASPVLRQGGDWAACYRAEWRHFLRSIERDTPVGCTLEDGRSAVAVALAAIESAASGRPAAVSQAPRAPKADAAGRHDD